MILKIEVMKKLFYVSLWLVLIVVYSCEKDSIVKNKVLNITTINQSKSQIVNVKLKSMEKKAFSIGCHVASSTTFNAKNKTFGYMDCGTQYCIIDIEAGREIKKISLPVSISLTVVDTIRNVLIGHYYINGTEPNNGTDHVLTVSLNDGNVISDKQFYVGGFWDATTSFFRDIENEYVLLRSDNVLVFVNPSTGNIIRTLDIDTDLTQGIYDRKNNRLIGNTYSNETGKNYIVTVDINTGKTLSKVIAQGLGFHLAFEMDYDAETNCYVLVSDKNEVLFFDVATGKIKDRYQLDFDLTSLKLWRSKK